MIGKLDSSDTTPNPENGRTKALPPAGILFRLARLFLEGQWQNTAAGKPTGFALLFPMNDLFEAFVGRCLQRAHAPLPVRLQAQGQFALKNQKDESLFALQPDAVVKHRGGCIVLDTKWKELDQARNDLCVTPGDIYQMLAYCRAYGAARAILLYPWHKEIGRDEGILRRWTAKETHPFPVHVATVNVGRPNDVPNILRKIVNDVSDGELNR